MSEMCISDVSLQGCNTGWGAGESSCIQLSTSTQVSSTETGSNPIPHHVVKVAEEKSTNHQFLHMSSEVSIRSHDPIPCPNEMVEEGSDHQSIEVQSWLTFTCRGMSPLSSSRDQFQGDNYMSSQFMTPVPKTLVVVLTPCGTVAQNTFCRDATSSTPLLSSFQPAICLLLASKGFGSKIPMGGGRSAFQHSTTSCEAHVSDINGVVNHKDWSTPLTQLSSFLFTLAYSLFIFLSWIFVCLSLISSLLTSPAES